MSTTSILSVIQHYQRSIEKSQTDEARLLHCVSKLYKLPVKVEHLQETGIGKTVNALRKFEGEIGAAAKALVAKWKAMVASEEEPMETDCQQDEENNFYKKDGDGDGHDDDYNHNEQKCSPYPLQTTQLSVNEIKKNIEIKENKDNQEEHNHLSISSHHKSSGMDVQVGTSSKHKPSSEKKHSEKHHKSRHKQEKEEQKGNDKPKEHDSGEQKREDRHKSSSRRHKSSEVDKEEHRVNKTHKSENRSEREKGHRDHKESISNLKNENRDSPKDSSYKHKSTSKGDGHHRDKKKHSNSSTPSSLKSKSLSVHTEENPAPSSDRKRRRHDSEKDTPKESKSKSSAKPNEVKKCKTGAAKVEANNDDDYIDSSMGTNFADVLGMLNVPTKKSKKITAKSPLTNNKASSSAHTHGKSADNCKDSPSKAKSAKSPKLNGTKYSKSLSSKDVKPDLLSSSTKLEPLDPNIVLALPTISTNYKPMPLNQTVMDCVFASSSSTSSAPVLKAPVRTLTDAQALSHGISSKTMRTKIYSGMRTGQLLQVPTLFDLCIRMLQKNIDALEYTGGVPFEVLRPVLERASPQQLLVFEEYNPYLMEDSDTLWQQHVQRHYRSQKRKEMESWREMFLRCQDDQERKLNILAESIKQSQKIIAAPVRKTQLAFLDSMVKPPRNVQRKQEQYGTKSTLVATPASRVAALSSVAPNAAKTGDARLRIAASVRDTAQACASNFVRPKKAPLMAKTLQFMRGRQKR